MCILRFYVNKSCSDLSGQLFGVKDMNKETIIEKVKIELRKTNIYEDKYYYLIGRMFDFVYSNDMQLKIELSETEARLFTRERGQCVYEYFTKNIDDVIYFILYDLICIIAFNMTMAKYSDGEKSMIYTDDVRNYRKNLEETAFSSVGGIYEKWFKNGRTSLMV